MNFNIKISKIVVLITDGTDHVSIYTDLPSPYPPSLSSQPLQIEFKTTKGKAIEYVKENFGIEPEVIDVQSLMKEGMQKAREENIKKFGR